MVKAPAQELADLCGHVQGLDALDGSFPCSHTQQHGDGQRTERLKLPMAKLMIVVRGLVRLLDAEV